MMGVLKKTTAWVLIGIFQIFLMHQSLPHQHHTHDKTYAVIDKADHHHSHHHHHHGDSQHSHDSPKQDHSNTSDHHSGLLGMLFGEHSHSNETNHQHTLTTATFQNQKVKEFGGLNLQHQNFNLTSYQLVLLPAHYSPPIQSLYFYNPALSHRGPPSTV